MSGGEPSSIKRSAMCAAGNLRACICGHTPFLFVRRGDTALYQALYRKWRPRTFDDVVGQEHITTTLKHEVASSKFSHAYLFTGSRGTGKTTCSKIIAKAVNCLHPADGNPCNQ